MVGLFLCGLHSTFVRHMHRTLHPFPLGHHLHHMRGLCVASEEILEFLYLTPPRHIKQTCSALGLIATFTSFSMTSKLLTQFLVRVVQLWHWHKKPPMGMLDVHPIGGFDWSVAVAPLSQERMCRQKAADTTLGKMWKPNSLSEWC